MRTAVVSVHDSSCFIVLVEEGVSNCDRKLQQEKVFCTIPYRSKYRHQERDGALLYISFVSGNGSQTESQLTES